MKKHISAVVRQFLRAVVLAAKRHYLVLWAGFCIAWLWFMHNLWMATGGPSVLPGLAIGLLFIALSASLLFGIIVVVIAAVMAFDALLDWCRDLWESARSNGDSYE